MQTSANRAGPSHSSDTLLLKPTLHLGPPNDTTTREVGQGERPVKSSWIRRLKPRDEVELMNGGSAPGGADMVNLEKCKDFIGHIELGLVTARGPEDKSLPKGNGLKARSDWVTEGVVVAKRQKIFGHNVAEKQMNAISKEQLEHGEGKIAGAIQPSMTGFGPWTKVKSGRNSVVKLSELGSSSKSNVSTALSSLDSSKQVHDRSSPTTSLINARQRCGPLSTQAEVSIPSLLGKRPMSPAHGKTGLPPRPPSQKTAACHLPIKVTSAVARRLLNQPLVDSQVKGQAEVVQRDIGRPVFSLQDKETRKFTEFKFMGLSSFSNEPNLSEGSFQVSCKAHTKDQEQVTSGQQLVASFSTRVGNSQLSSKHTLPFLAEGANTFLATREQNFGGADTQLERQRKNDEDLHPFCGGAIEVEEGVKESDGSESAKNVTYSSVAPGNSQGTSTDEKGEASVTAPPSLPWEMFTEPTGALRKEREQFVEVYNRARDELKKQRVPQNVSRSLAIEIDADPRLALGPGNGVSNSKQQLPMLRQEQLSAGKVQTPGTVKMASASPEHRSQSLCSNMKEQCSVRLAAGGGPVNPVTLPSSMKGGTADGQLLQCVQQPSSSKQERPLPDQLKLNLESTSYNKSSYRPEKSPVVFSHDRDGSGHMVVNTGHVASSSLALGVKGPVSKVEEHMRHGGPSQAADLLSPLLGKRSRVTFEDLDLSRVEEKCATSSRCSRQQVALHPHIWLSRWHAASNSDSRGSVDANVSTDIVRNGSVRYFSPGLNKFRNDEDAAVLGHGKDARQIRGDKDGGWKSFKMGSSTALPSAAAMAIVGTAARQYCSSAQPQRAGSFAFWSGFGRPIAPKVEGMEIKGKEKVFTKGNLNFPTC